MDHSYVGITVTKLSLVGAGRARDGKAEALLLRVNVAGTARSYGIIVLTWQWRAAQTDVFLSFVLFVD